MNTRTITLRDGTNADVPTFKTPYNADKFPKDDEINLEPSLTVPDEQLSIREIVERFSKGLPLPSTMTKQGHYELDEDDESEFPDTSKMDITEKEDYIEERAIELQVIKDRLKQKAQDNREKKKQKAEQQEEQKKKDLDKYLKERNAELGFRNDQSTNQTPPPSL